MTQPQTNPTPTQPDPIGATLTPGGTHFRVWAPDHEEVELIHYAQGREAAAYPLHPEADGYFSALVPGLGAGTRYAFRLDGGQPFPDPASRSQPDGVHEPSEVIDLRFPWGDAAWRGRPIEELVIYELHVGTATEEGTFDALVPRLPYLRNLGVTAIELMPVASFPGERNWGYDGVTLYAPSRNYGGARGLQRLVDAAHREGLAVLLDVVYNHLGPSGNYLRSYAQAYFTDRHHTPWGEALNFDGANSRPVRDFFIGNALYWLRDYHVDGFRLDATHTIKDDSHPHLLREIAEEIENHAPAKHHVVLIAEDERNERRLILPRDEEGYGLDAVWADDLHHQIRSALAGDNEGYYRDYTGTTEEIARTLERGWFYEGQPSEFLGVERGTSASGLPFPAFVHCIQNHDQIGNRALGERLNHDISLAAYRAASTLLLLDPATPLLFMGQEWAASAPFLYFTDHDKELGKLVTEGRREEFKHFSRFADESAREQIPDPQARDTFLRSKLNWKECNEAPHAGVLRLYHDLLAIRRQYPPTGNGDRAHTTARALGPNTVGLRCACPDGTLVLVVFNLRDTFTWQMDRDPLTTGYRWRLALASEAIPYGGEGQRAFAFVNTRLTLRGPCAAVFVGRA